MIFLGASPRPSAHSSRKRKTGDSGSDEEREQMKSRKKKSRKHRTLSPPAKSVAEIIDLDDNDNDNDPIEPIKVLPQPPSRPRPRPIVTSGNESASASVPVCGPSGANNVEEHGPLQDTTVCVFFIETFQLMPYQHCQNKPTIRSMTPRLEDTQFPSSPTLGSEPLSNGGSSSSTPTPGLASDEPPNGGPPSSVGKQSDDAIALQSELVPMPVSIPPAPAPTTAATSTQIEGSAGTALPRRTNVSSVDIFILH